MIPALLLALLPIVAACAPAADAVLRAPTFVLVAEGSGLSRLDPPGFGAGGATFRVVLDVHNPNPLPLRLAALEGELFVAGTRVAASRFPGGVDLAARGASRLDLEVAVGAERLPELTHALVDVLAGRGVSYRLDGGVGVEVLGAVHRFPTITLAQGTVQQDLTLRAPQVTVDSAASGVREVSFDRIVIDLALSVRNPNPIGVEVRAPDARLRLGEREVAVITIAPQRLPAHASATVVQRLVVNPIQLGAAAVTQLQQLAAGQPGAVDLAVTGRWELEVPGLTSVRLEPGELVRGRLN